MSTFAFDTLYRTSPAHWTEAMLRGCTTKELAALAELLAVPTSGTRLVLIARLLDIADLRTTLADWTDPTEVSARYKLKELQALAQRAGTFRWSTKYGVAAGLLTWRNQCRRKGQKAIQDARKLTPGTTRQLRMNFD